MTDWKKVVKGELLGRGTYGEVREYGDNAVKIFPIENAVTEFSIVGLDHPNIVTATQVGFTPSGDGYIMMKKALRDLTEPGSPPMGKKLEWCWQIANGIAYLTSLGIIHRDIKPSNCLLFKDGVKVADFGSSKMGICRSSLQSSGDSYILPYRAPELALGGKLTPKCDVWALGCTFYYIMTGENLFPAHDERDLLYKIFRLRGTPTKSTWPEVVDLPDWDPTFPMWGGNKINTGNSDMDDVITYMLTLNPKRRPDIYAVVGNSIFDKVKMSNQIYQPVHPTLVLKTFFIPVAKYESSKRSKLLESLMDLGKDLPAGRFFLGARIFDETYRQLSPSDVVAYLGALFIIMQGDDFSGIVDNPDCITSTSAIYTYLRKVLETIKYRVLQTTVFDYLVCEHSVDPDVKLEDSEKLVREVADTYIQPDGMSLKYNDFVKKAKIITGYVSPTIIPPTIPQLSIRGPVRKF